MQQQQLTYHPLCHRGSHMSILTGSRTLGHVTKLAPAYHYINTLVAHNSIKTFETPKHQITVVPTACLTSWNINRLIYYPLLQNASSRNLRKRFSWSAWELKLSVQILWPGFSQHTVYGTHLRHVQGQNNLHHSFTFSSKVFQWLTSLTSRTWR